MAATTIYDIKLRYVLKDEASKSARRLAREFDRASKSSKGLGGGIRRIAALGVAGLGLRQAGKALIGFNSDMQQARIQMGGMIQLAAQGKSTWKESFGTATKLTEEFQVIAEKSVGTTKDFVEMASRIIRPVTGAGLGMKELRDFTKGAVIASQAFGIESGMAARDIESALMGQLRSVDRFARALLEPLGVIGEEGRKGFNELTAAQRASVLKFALTQPAIQQMADAQEKSFSGVFSTFQDKFQIFMGKVGLPLFEALTAEIRQWNDWLSANEETVKRVAQSISSGIMSFFKFIRSTIGFFVDHKSTLLFIAKAWAGFKIGKAVGGIIGGAGGMAGRGIRRGGALAGAAGMDRTMLGLGKFGARVGSVTGALGRLLPAVGLGVVAFKGIYDVFTAESRKKAEAAKRERARQAKVLKEFSLPELAKEAGKGAARRREFTSGKLLQLEKLTSKLSVQSAADRQAFHKSELLEVTRLTTELAELEPRMQAFYRTLSTGLQEASANVPNLFERFIGGASAESLNMAELDILSGAIAKAYKIDNAQAFTTDLIKLQGALRASKTPTADFAAMLKGTFIPAALLAGRKLTPTAEEGGVGMPEDIKALLETLKGKGAGKVSVTIQRIEVKSDDPDRFVFGMKAAFADAAKNPSGVRDAFTRRVAREG